MSSYNIIYTSAKKEKYLWAGHKFEKLHSAGNENLYFSGKAFKHEELAKELEACGKAAVLTFKDDLKPMIMPVAILVGK